MKWNVANFLFRGLKMRWHCW